MTHNVDHSSSATDNYERSSVLTALDGWKEVKTIERPFNEVEGRYRLLASTWFLAAFGGMGYVLSAHNKIPFPSAWIILGISVAASLGIQLLWVIDLLVYRRLSDANFLTGLKLEKTNPTLPQVGWSQVEYFKGQGTTKQVVLFYVGCSATPILFGLPTFFLLVR